MRIPKLRPSLVLLVIPPCLLVVAARLLTDVAPPADWDVDDDGAADAAAPADASDDAASTICAQLGDASSETRAVAACRAWQSPAGRDPKVQCALLRATIDLDGVVRSCAENAFRVVRDDLCVDEVLAFAWKSGRPQLRATALAAVPPSRNHVELIGAWVRRALKDPDGDVVRAAFDRLPLAGMPDDECVEFVMEALHHGRKGVQLAALYAAQRAGPVAAAAFSAIAAVARRGGMIGAVGVETLCVVDPGREETSHVVREAMQSDEDVLREAAFRVADRTSLSGEALRAECERAVIDDSVRVKESARSLLGRLASR